MAAEQLLSTIKKQAQVPETPLASQPKVVQPPAVMPQTNAGLPPIQSPVNQPPSINPAYRTPEVRATPQVTPNLNPWVGTYGGANPNYVPTSDRDKAFGDPSLSATDKANLTQNYLKSKGIDTGAQMPQSDEEALKLMQDEQIREKTMLDKRIEQGLASAKKQLEGSTGAINATVGAVNREGLVSAGNKIAANQALEGFNLQFNQLSEQYAEQQRQLAKAQQQQNWNAVNQISKNMENTQIALQQSSARAREESQGWLNFYKENGLLSSATPEQLSGIAMKHGLDPVLVQSAANAEKYKTASDQAKSELDNRIKGVGALTNIFEKGGELSLDDLTSLAGTFDLPMESAISAYQGFNALRNDKSLSNEEKALKGQEIRTKLDREMRGITNSALETQDYFQKQVLAINSNSNLSAEQKSTQISNLAMNLKLDDSRNPLTQTEQKIKNAELAMSQAKLNGQPLGAQEWADFGNTWQQGVNYGLQPSAVIPQGGKYNIQNTDNGLNIAAQVGARGGQCGAFVNDCFGKRIVGDSYQQKMSLTDPSITIPTPGMAFVQAVGGKAAPYGHIGMVESVDYAKGTMNIVDSNWGSNEVIQRRTIPISAANGFIRPPNGQPVTAGTSTQVSGMTDASILEAYEKAGKIFTSVKEANNAITLAKQTGFVPSDGGKEGLTDKQFTQINQLTNQYNDINKEIRTLNQGAASIKGFDINTTNPYDDQKLIFAFMKVLDPGSVVKETEFATAQKNTSLLNSMAANWQQAATGTGMILPAQRQKILDTMNALTGEKEALYDDLLSKAVDKGAKLGFKDPTLYLEYLPKSYKTEDQKKEIEASAAKTAEQIKGFLDFGKSLIQDHQTRTGQFIVPEDAPSTNYTP